MKMGTASEIPATPSSGLFRPLFLGVPRRCSSAAAPLSSPRCVPVAASFCAFARRYVEDVLGFTLAWRYWFNDVVSTAPLDDNHNDQTMRPR